MSNTNHQVTARIAQWIAADGTRQRSEAELLIATQSFVDTIACALAGSVEQGPITLRDVLAGDGAQASIIGSPLRASARIAAQINGMAGHVLDYDDYELVAFSHPSVTLVSVALALGEQLNRSGKAILNAYITGYEVAQTVGAAVSPTDYLAGFHTTGTTGTLGSCATACALLGLDAPRTRMALGIASSLASGVRTNFGTDTKPLHAGHAAANAILAATLAQRGFTASSEGIESDFGFAHTHAPSQRHLLEAQVDRLYSREIGITRHPPTRKPYASCGCTHAAIFAALSLRHLAPAPDAIEGIIVEGAEQFHRVLIHSRPSTGLEAKFSMEASLALALVDGAAGMQQFTDASVQRASVQRLIKMVEVRDSDEFSRMWQRGDSLPAAVTLITKNARDRSECVNAPGSPNHPMSHETLMAKFSECADGILGKAGAQASAALLLKMTELDSIAPLMASLRAR